VLRAFDDPSIPHVGENNPLRDIQNVDFDLIVSDLGQTEKRLERLEKDSRRAYAPQLNRNSPCSSAPKRILKLRNRYGK